MDLWNVLYTTVITGGPPAIITILIVLLVFCLIGWRMTYTALKAKELLLQKKDERADKVLSEYYEANKTITEAITSVQIALVEIKSKL